MKTQRRGVAYNRQIKQTGERIDQVEAGIGNAGTRAELAERRTELAETRTELAETRAALAEVRAEQAEMTLQSVIQKRTDACNGSASTPSFERRPANGMAAQARPLEHLTSRQREILQHIAVGQNTKQIAEILRVSPKTVEYHRAKLMRAVRVHDIPGLVRLAVRAGLVPEGH
jgi:DNA-binding NarL/FixJ family response regulator